MTTALASKSVSRELRANCISLEEQRRQVNVISQRDFAERQKEKRSEFRIGVALPALASAGGIKFSISVINIAVQGAMIETLTVLQKGARLAIGCGTVNVRAVVVWCGPDRQYGLRFERPLTQREVEEQIARSSAVSSFRDQLPARRAPSIVGLGQG